MATPLQRQIAIKVVGSISCIGSGYIIQDVLRHPDRRSKSVYHRIMVGLSAMDIFYTFFIHFLGSWLMPKGSGLWAAGNMASCDAAAFIGIFGYLGSTLYNCSLSTYYSLQLKYNWQDRRMKKIEKWFHIIPCSIALLYSTIALCTKTFGPNLSSCGPVAYNYPEGCSNKPDSEVKCIRTVEMMNIVLLMIGFLVPCICLLYVSITMFRVYRAVRDVETNVIKYSFMARHRVQDKKKTMKRSRRIMIQGVLYSVAMILTWIFVFISAVIFLISKKPSPVISWFVIVLQPLQGAFNLLIYLTPVFRKMLKTRRLRKKELENKAFNEDEKKEKNTAINPISPSPGKTLIQPQGNKKSVCFQEEEEEEKREIEPLPRVFSLERGEKGHDEEEQIHATQNNEDNISDDGNDYY